jgi:hypothetical protein
VSPIRPLYTVSSEGAVALSAGVAKSVIGIKTAADFGLDLVKLRVGFDGVTASAVPVLVQLMLATFATNGPGTNSTSTTPRQVGGRVIAHGISAAANWTTEPTVLTIVDELPLLTPAGGEIMYDYPLGDAPDCDLNQGFVLRCNAPAGVNVRSDFWFSRI